jgi:hypothetical protein
LDIIEIELAAAQTGKIFQFNTGVNTDTLAATILKIWKITKDIKIKFPVIQILNGSVCY